MDLRSFSSPSCRSLQPILGRLGRGGLIAVVLAAAVGLAGCGSQAVRASEKELLADRVMIFDHDGQETAADEHIMTNREGSAGGRGAAGGGCGCN